MHRLKLSSDLLQHPWHQPILLDNETCVYCGTLLTKALTTKEHVIGRRFVPRGKLNGQWNLIVRACKPCNKQKSDLEDDISAISMQPDAWGRHATQDQSLKAEAERKAGNSVSRRTKKPVSESVETLTVKMPFAQAGEMTFTGTAPPQVDSERIFALSRLHLMAFFYWITYDHSTKSGRYWMGSFFPVLEAVRSDWGNQIHRAFMDAVIDWEPRVLATGADGYFKVAIRRHPSATCWSWALEWNKNYRIVGFFGEQNPVEALVDTFPDLEIKSIVEGNNRWLRFHAETLLSEDDDRMFCWDDIKLAR